jgi:hypothetical protein
LSAGDVRGGGAKTRHGSPRLDNGIQIIARLELSSTEPTHLVSVSEGSWEATTFE